VYTRRFLAVSLTAATFILTLYFAAVVGAQEERTETQTLTVAQKQDATGEQVLKVEQQQVQNEKDQQQQVSEVQQQQVGVQSHQSCPGARHEGTVTDPTTRRVIHPNITGGAVRITYEIIGEPEGDELFFELRDEDGDIVVSETVDDATTEPKTIRASTNPGKHEFEVEADSDVEYRVELEDCTNVEARNENDGGDGGGDGGAGDGDGSNNPVGVAQENTTPDTTTPETTTADTDTTDTVADALNEATTANDGSNADSVREADAFRCDFFLRVVSDENGALRAQYLDGDRDDELIVQRFEQCLSEDVLADTIPDRKLPFTGGPFLPFGAGLLLLVAAAVLAGRIIRR
jgi:hypothetical protein